MIHRARAFNLTDATIDQIAQTLHARTQTLCTGFRVTGAERSAEGAGRACPAAAFILNDAFSEDGAQEYAVVRVLDRVSPQTYRVVLTESITVSWIDRAERVAELLRQAMAPGAPTYGVPFTLTVQIDAPYPHCGHCA